MFTGLVDDVGTIVRVAATDAGRELRLSCRYEDLVPGESIALDGVCLTVRDCEPRAFTVSAVVTTLDRTTMSSWAAGRRVNLERALRAGDRLGGHFVQGHVDGVGTVRRTAELDDALLIDVELPAAVTGLVVRRGSICIDGVSLTVNDIPSDGVVQLSIIEYTRRHTTLGSLRAGDRVHVEGDVLGKYVQAFLRDSGLGIPDSGLGIREREILAPDPRISTHDSRIPIPESRISHPETRRPREHLWLSEP